MSGQRGYALPDHATMVRNIAAVLDTASGEDWADGAAWYRQAHDVAKLAHPDVRAGAGMLAVLSPRLSWEWNVAAALEVGAGRPVSVPCIHGNVAKALAIRDGADPLEYLRGAKVRAFHASITDPDDPDAVCVDRHAVAIALGGTLSDRDTQRAVSGRRYDAIADAYRAVAAARGLLPSTVQAVTWCAWRRIPHRDRPVAGE